MCALCKDLFSLPVLYRLYLPASTSCFSVIYLWSSKLLSRTLPLCFDLLKIYIYIYVISTQNLSSQSILGLNYNNLFKVKTEKSKKSIMMGLFGSCRHTMHGPQQRLTVRSTDDGVKSWREMGEGRASCWELGEDNNKANNNLLSYDCILYV